MPPKKQKQTPRNAYFYFMLDFKNSQGRNFRSMKEVAEAASPIWSRMGKEERKPYEERALMEKNNLRGGKFTSEGYDVALLEEEEMQENKRMEEMRHNINCTITMADRGGVLPEEIFCIIHINTFVYCVSEKRYYPAEIAVSAFSLQDGIANEENVFHKLVKPGQLPLGYAADARVLSNESHQIDPPTFGENEFNIEEVFYDLKDFLETRLVGSRRMPVLYTPAKQMKMVQQVLDTWCEDFGEPRLFQVYNLQYMFRVLRNAVARSNMWSSDTFSDRIIEMDKFAYSKGICCTYHDVTSVPHHCSRSFVVRYAYTICDNCCGDLDIPLVPGHHVPHCSKVPKIRASSELSLASSNRSSNMRPTTRDDDSESVNSLSTNSEWDRQSVTSDTSATDTTADEYPALPAAGKHSASSPYSYMNFGDSDKVSVSSYSSGRSRSYAGSCTSGRGRKQADLPSSLVNNMNRLEVGSNASGTSGFSMNRNEFPTLENVPRSMGRGRRPKSNSQTSSTTA